MSSTYRCDLCKDPDLNATYVMYPGFPAKRYVQGHDEVYPDPTMYAGEPAAAGINRSYDLCEACRIQYTELINTFLGRK